MLRAISALGAYSLCNFEAKASLEVRNFEVILILYSHYNIVKRPALHNKRVTALRMAFRARKVFGTFEKQVPNLYAHADGAACESASEVTNAITTLV